MNREEVLQILRLHQEELKKCGLVSSIKPSIDHLVNVTDFWVSPSLYNQVLQIVGE